MRPFILSLALGLAGCTAGSPVESASRFATLQVAGDGTGQYAFLTAEDTRVVDSSATSDVKLLTTEPTLAATVDSAKVARIVDDSARVAVYVSLPNLEGLSDSIRKAKAADIEFLRSRPRRSVIDTVVVVREHRRWLVSVDARFRAGAFPLSQAAFGFDSSLVEKDAAANKLMEFYKSHSRPLPEHLSKAISELHQSLAYNDSLIVEGRVVRNPIFLSAPSLGSHQIEGTLRNLGGRSVYLARVVATLPSGEKKVIYVFNTLHSTTKSFTEYGLYGDQELSFALAEIQFNRQ